MGRAKLNMELISKERSRNITFKKRKEGLIRKMHEFTTLCDVSACMIICGPRQEKASAEPEIWPQDLDEIHRIIGIYKAKNKETGNKTFGLSDFFHDRKRKIEDELAKLRKRNMEAKYPTRHELINCMAEAKLRGFAASLSNKLAYVKSRIEMIRRNKQGLNMNLMDFAQSRLNQSHSLNPPALGMRGIELEVINQQQQPISSVKPPIEMHAPIQYPTIDHHQDLHSMNQNSMMMLLMNDNDHYVQFGGASTSGNIQCASFKRQLFYESMAGHGVVDPMNMICHNPTTSLARYYVPPVPPLPYMQCTMMPLPGVAPPQLPFSIRENHDAGQEDFVQYDTKNKRGL